MVEFEQLRLSGLLVSGEGAKGRAVAGAQKPELRRAKTSRLGSEATKQCRALRNDLQAEGLSEAKDEGCFIEKLFLKGVSGSELVSFFSRKRNSNKSLLYGGNNKPVGTHRTSNNVMIGGVCLNRRRKDIQSEGTSDLERASTFS